MSTLGNGAQRRAGQAHDRDSARHRSGNHESIEDGGVRNDAERGVRWNSQNYPRRRADPTGPHRRLIESVAAPTRLMRKSFVRNQTLWTFAALAVSIFLCACNTRKNAVSGTIEVDEAHVGPRAGGRVEKILAWEGDRLHEGQVIVQLDASELRARRDLAAAQIDTAVHDADAQEAQLQFLRDEARRQQDLLKRRVVSSSDAERADSSAKTQEKNVAAGKMRVAQARAQLADTEAQLKEMQVIAPADSILEVLSVKVGDILVPPFNQEVATLLLPQHLWVRVYVPEPWLGLIKIGDHVRVRVDSFPGKDFPGEIEQINRQAEFTPRNIQTVEDWIKQVFGVKIRLPNNDDRLRAGMSADVYFPNVK